MAVSEGNGKIQKLVRELREHLQQCAGILMSGSGFFADASTGPGACAASGVPD